MEVVRSSETSEEPRYSTRCNYQKDGLYPKTIVKFRKLVSAGVFVHFYISSLQDENAVWLSQKQDIARELS
jgi:hypothetical protein